METIVCEHVQQLGAISAAAGAACIRRAIQQRGEANIIVATGASQFVTLSSLIAEPEIDWRLVTGFHLDEYIGLPMSHPASFRRYLKERLVDHLPLNAFHYVNGDEEPLAECKRLGDILGNHPIDVAFIGIGENGHIAFNDPPADFATSAPYIVVDLDEACRRQQLGEGWFGTLDEVPAQAISMSVSQIMKSGTIICSVPDQRKAIAVRDAIDGPVTPNVPASILQQHKQATLYLDLPAASLLRTV